MLKQWIAAVAGLGLSSLVMAASPVAGEDYKVLDTPVETSVDEGQIEVTEVFWYGCPHCYNLEEPLNAWVDEFPDDVTFQRLPATMGDTWTAHARAFYAAQQLGILDQVHSDFFDAIQQQGQRLTDPDDIAAFFSDGLPANLDLPPGQRPTAFHLPGLRAQPWWAAPDHDRSRCDSTMHRVMSALQAADPAALRAEFLALRQRGCSEDIAVERGAWRQFHLMEEGRMNVGNCDNCPAAVALLNALPVCDSAFGYAYFSVLAPGIRMDDFEVSVKDDCLIVKGETGGRSVDQTLRLPRDADSEVARAYHADGILTIDVPKRAVAPARSIEIKVGKPAEATASSSTLPSQEEAPKAPVEPLAALAAMGFTETELAQVALDKHDADVAAASAALTALDGEWAATLDDLEEMGFGDRHANSKALLAHDGSVKLAVKALVANS